MKSYASAMAALLAVLSASPALAGRNPDASERAKIEQSLTDSGYTSWGEIEFERELGWEVDNALHSDGKRYDLYLDASDFGVRNRELD